MNKNRFCIITLAVMLCMAAFSSVAYAAEGDETEPTETSGNEDGNLITRDVLYNESTNKQFIAVETRNGKVFYIIIDYDKPVDEDLEQYHAYFLNMVDERDLLNIIAEEDLPEEDTSQESSIVVAPEPTSEPELDRQTEPTQQSNTGGIIAVVLIIALIAGGAVYFIKFHKPKQTVKGKIDPDEYDFDEDDDEPEDEPDEPYEQEDEADTEDKQQ